MTRLLLAFALLFGGALPAVAQGRGVPDQDAEDSTPARQVADLAPALAEALVKTCADNMRYVMYGSGGGEAIMPRMAACAADRLAGPRPEGDPVMIDDPKIGWPATATTSSNRRAAAESKPRSRAARSR